MRSISKPVILRKSFRSLENHGRNFAPGYESQSKFLTVSHSSRIYYVNVKLTTQAAALIHRISPGQQFEIPAKPARKEGYEHTKAYHIKGLSKPTASKTDVVALGAVRRPAVTIILPGGSEGLAALARGVKSHWCPWAG